ncbi:GntR family transcriptional regulator [Alsobacter metallidurans]|uniref:GntR family transcriptional regulator n=1 Tax=Alsobacter metallidurans TaxID=340221 RepID=A0A917I7G6_9HYPH|nr:GntR family transcriptional regulator [Alsobacter metallidurans]
MAGVDVPKARQVYLVLRERIASGGLHSGDVLPGEQALAAEHNVSRITVRKALAELEREGMVDRRRGAGTFVRLAAAPKPVVADIADVLSNLVAMGRGTDVRLLAFGYGEPASAVAEALRLAPGERAQRSVRVRMVDGEPFSHLTTHVPERIGVTYSEAELASRPLLALLERSGVEVDRATQEIGAVLATPDVAAALNIDIGSALIALTRVVYDAEGRGVEHLAALYRPDRYAFRMDLERTGADDGRRWSPATGEHQSTKRSRSARKHEGKAQ